MQGGETWEEPRGEPWGGSRGPWRCFFIGGHTRRLAQNEAWRLEANRKLRRSAEMEVASRATAPRLFSKRPVASRVSSPREMVKRRRSQPSQQPSPPPSDTPPSSSDTPTTQPLPMPMPSNSLDTPCTADRRHRSAPPERPQSTPSAAAHAPRKCNGRRSLSRSERKASKASRSREKEKKRKTLRRCCSVSSRRWPLLLCRGARGGARGARGGARRGAWGGARGGRELE